jgi:hypothetical protein
MCNFCYVSLPFRVSFEVFRRLSKPGLYTTVVPGGWDPCFAIPSHCVIISTHYIWCNYIYYIYILYIGTYYIHTIYIHTIYIYIIGTYLIYALYMYIYGSDPQVTIGWMIWCTLHRVHRTLALICFGLSARLKGGFFQS